MKKAFIQASKCYGALFLSLLLIAFVLPTYVLKIVVTVIKDVFDAIEDALNKFF